jgi:hypothetical protein
MVSLVVSGRCSLGFKVSSLRHMWVFAIGKGACMSAAARICRGKNKKKFGDLLKWRPVAPEHSSRLCNI